MYFMVNLIDIIYINKDLQSSSKILSVMGLEIKKLNSSRRIFLSNNLCPNLNINVKNIKYPLEMYILLNSVITPEL